MMEPLWMPSAGVQLLPCHRWFDAVRTSSFLGTLAFEGLQYRSGPVIEDQTAGTFYWLIRVGAAQGWALPGVHVLGQGSTLSVPPPAWKEGPALHWLLPVPASGRVLTDPQLLHDSLKVAGHGLRFPDPVKALRRCDCGDLVVESEDHGCGIGERGRGAAR